MALRPRLTAVQGKLRHAVRLSLQKNTKPGHSLLLAVSGGADSMALAAATLFEAKKLDLKLSAAVIDHGLQSGSDRVAKETVNRLRALGISEIYLKKVTVGKSGGLEAAARKARYGALDKIAKAIKADLVLLGHTSSDQAETVLIGLVRGSGPKSIAGMSELTGKYLRPLLEITRSETEAFCKDSGIKFWKDPQNQDLKFLRVRVRKKVLPVLEQQLGPGVAEALVRTSTQLREDEQFLTALATKELSKARKVATGKLSLDVARLKKLDKAILNRVIKLALDGFQVESSRKHVLAVSDLVTNWHGQKPLSLPGVRVERKGQVIILRANQES